MFKQCVVFFVIVLATVLARAASARQRNANRLHTQILRDGYARLPRVLEEGEARSWGELVLAATKAEAATCMACASADDITDTACFGCERTGSSVGSKSFLRARRLARLQPRLVDLITSPRLARVAARAMNVSRVRLYQATAFVKEPGDAPSGWHQDAVAMPLAGDKIVTMWLALDNVTAEAGPLVFAAGSHLPGVPVPSLRDLPLPQRLSAMTRWSDEDVARLTGLNITRPRDMRAGDVTLHLGYTLHAAPPNSSPTARPALAITYFADGARVHPDLLTVDDGKDSAAVDAQGSMVKDNKGIRLSPEGGGPPLIVRLLSDDASTWMPWLQARPPLLVPGQAVRHPTLTPLVHDEERDGKGKEA